MLKSIPKACPFCDSDDVTVKLLEINTYDEKGGLPLCVQCNTCKARGPVVYGMDMDNDYPVNQWNERPQEDRLGKMVLATERRLRR